MPNTVMAALATISISLLLAAFLLYFAYFRPQRKEIDLLRIQLEADKEHLKKDLENREKEIQLSAREQAQKYREQADEDNKQDRIEIQRLERKLAQKEEALDDKLDALERQRSDLAQVENHIAQDKNLAAELVVDRRSALERVSGMSVDDARTAILKDVENDTRMDAARLVHQIEEEAKAEGEKRARNIVSIAIQRIASDHVSETTVSVVHLPSDDIKGRIIGREGRNIRAFETLTGVDVIIDDTPEAVVLSSFDPVRREVARLALNALVVDGRIHPGRIEETVEKAREDVDLFLKEAGERAVMESGVTGLHPEIVKLLGRMKYRTSYGQNLLDHSIEVCLIGTSLAAELGANINVVKRAALLHDLGKIVPDAEGPHALLSMEIMLKYGETQAAAHAAGAHHNEISMDTVEDVIVQLADSVSAARPGARREMLETYVKRLQKLETIAESFPGVEKTYAVQAGREIRLMVRPEAIDDAAAHKLARDAAKRIEEEMDYPGQIKVTVIRETRSIDYAK